MSKIYRYYNVSYAITDKIKLLSGNPDYSGFPIINNKEFDLDVIIDYFENVDVHIRDTSYHYIFLEDLVYNLQGNPVVDFVLDNYILIEEELIIAAIMNANIKSFHEYIYDQSVLIHNRIKEFDKRFELIGELAYQTPEFEHQLQLEKTLYDNAKKRFYFFSERIYNCYGRFFAYDIVNVYLEFLEYILSNNKITIYKELYKELSYEIREHYSIDV